MPAMLILNFPCVIYDVETEIVTHHFRTGTEVVLEAEAKIAVVVEKGGPIQTFRMRFCYNDKTKQFT